MKISVVSPIYKAENTLYELVSRISSTVKQITEDFEIILVDDFSPDNSWKVIENLSKEFPQIQGVKLSRNFGQHYAITAGLDHISGDWIVVLDCDLQDRPEEILNLYKKAQEGYHIVKGSRKQRIDSFLKKMQSKIFYFILSYLTGTKHDSSVANFGIYKREVINAIGQLRESVRYFPTMVKWVGFKSTIIEVEHSKREYGKSSYTLTKLLRLSLDIILANSDKPMKITIKLGILISSIAFTLGGITLFKYFTGQIVVQGFLTLSLSIWFLSGLIITTLGILGLYIGKIFDGVKKRPIYIVEKITLNDSKS